MSAKRSPDEQQPSAASASSVEPHESEVEQAAAAAEPTSQEDDTNQEQAVVEDSAKLVEELQKATDRALRAQAELENYRKRVQREMEDLRRYATLPLLEDLLVVVDNLQRALEVAQDQQGAEGLREGVALVAQQLDAILKQHDCELIDAVGQPFDPHWHEAVAQEPSEQYPAGVVSRVTRTGYRLHDRVVRPAQVFVSTGPPEPAAEAEGDASGE